MKKSVLFFFLLFSFLSFGQNSHEVDVQLRLKSSDSEFIRKSLLYEACLRMAEKFAPELQVNFSDFQAQLDKKFQVHLNKLKAKKLSEKFGFDYANTLSTEQKNQFFKTIGLNELELLQNYSGLLQSIVGHKFKNLKQDSNESTLWQASLELELDKSKLTALFKRMMSEEFAYVSKLFIYTEIDNDGFQWEEMNLSHGDLFIRPIQSSWLQWFQENLAATFDEVEICLQKCFQFYREWISVEATQLNTPLEFIDARLLRIHLKLKKNIVASSGLNEVSFSWDGRVVLQDVNTKKNLGSFSLPREHKTFKNLDQKSLNSALASYIYRLPLTSFLQFKNIHEANKAPIKVAPLILRGFRHMGDVQGYISALKSRGKLLGLEPVLTGFSKEEAFLTCYYRGEEKSFSDLLSGIKELKLSQTYNFIGDFAGLHHTIKFFTESP